MTTRPNQPASDEADRDKEPTPGGVARDLERKADELDAEVKPAEKVLEAFNADDVLERPGHPPQPSEPPESLASDADAPAPPG